MSCNGKTNFYEFLSSNRKINKIKIIDEYLTQVRPGYGEMVHELEGEQQFEHER